MLLVQTEGARARTLMEPAGEPASGLLAKLLRSVSVRRYQRHGFLAHARCDCRIWCLTFERGLLLVGQVDCGQIKLSVRNVSLPLWFWLAPLYERQAPLSQPCTALYFHILSKHASGMLQGASSLLCRSIGSEGPL